MDTGELLGRTLARFHSRIAFEDRGFESVCWVWKARKSPAGYGYFQVTRADFIESMAHRASWILHRGQIPDGFDVDHICRQRDCVRPKHLRLLTHRENMLAGDTVIARSVSRTHCPHGHAYTTENTYIYKGARQCRACRSRRSREFHVKGH